MFVVGLTGNYGMGKSTVLRMFRELGAVTIDADIVVGRLLKQKEVIKNIKELLGTGIFSERGRLDKKKLAEKIFKNKNLRIKLEDLLHPLVFNWVDRFINSPNNENRVFIVEAPLIFERGYEGRFDRIIIVFADEKTAMRRLGLRGITPETARERLKCQLPIKTKIRKSDFTIDNGGSPAKTMLQVKAIYEKLSEEAKIKNLIMQGKVDEASRLLKKPFYIEGRVIKGAGRGGKLLHTPTANIAFSGLSPKEGVYAARVSLSSKIYDAVANIGRNPTFGEYALSYEVHIFNFSGNLLGKKLRVYFIRRIRDERRFPNVKALETQIKKDIKKAREILARS